MHIPVHQKNKNTTKQGGSLILNISYFESL